MEVNFNFEGLINTLLMAKINEKSPEAAKIFNVFLKRGIPVVDAMAMLMELIAIAEEIQENGEGEGAE